MWRTSLRRDYALTLQTGSADDLAGHFRLEVLSDTLWHRLVVSHDVTTSSTDSLRPSRTSRSLRKPERPTSAIMAGIAALYAVETVFTVLALLAVGLRLWARHLTKRELALNDWAAIGALVISSKISVWSL